MGKAPCGAPSPVSYTVLGLDMANSQQSLRAWVQWDNIPGLLSLWPVALTEARNLSAVQCLWVAWRNKDTRSLWGWPLASKLLSQHQVQVHGAVTASTQAPAANAFLLSQNPAPRPQAPGPSAYKALAPAFPLHH